MRCEKQGIQTSLELTGNVKECQWWQGLWRVTDWDIMEGYNFMIERAREAKRSQEESEIELLLRAQVVAQSR